MNKADKFIRGAIFLLASAILAVIVSETIEFWSTTFEQGLLFLMAIALILNTIFVGNTILSVNKTIEKTMESIDDTVTETVNAIGIKVRYIENRWREDGYREGKVFEAVQNIVVQAEKEILISGYNNPQFDPTLTSIINANFEDDSQRQRVAYLETIEKKLENSQQKTFKYYRIIQMPNAHTVRLSPITMGPIEFEHCLDVLEIKNKTRNPSINIMKMETERISTFMIIDNKFLILSDIGVRQTDNRQGEYLAGVFIVEDLTGNVVEGFSDYFWSELVPNAAVIERKDLFISSEPPTL